MSARGGLPLHRFVRSVPFLHHALLFLGLAALTRCGLALRTGLETVPASLWPGVLMRGVGFDLLVLAWLLAPALLWAAVTPARWRHTRWRDPLRLLLFFGNATFLLFIALSEVTFWEEFSTRFNFIAVDYLIYTQEVIGNLRESYPVGWLVAGIAALSWLLTWTLRRSIAAVPAAEVSLRWRLVYVLLAFALPALAWKLSDIDRMQFSGNAYANELAGNGMMTFTAALQRNELDYGRFYATLSTERADRILRGLGVERKPLTQALQAGADEGEGFDARRLPLRRAPRNVVIITVESLSASFLGSFGNADKLTPRLDALAKEGLLFTRMYATGTRTVRGLEALTLGTPPIPGQAIVRRLGNDHLATLGEVLRPQGFEPLFFYGGYGYFDNMNAFYTGNGFEVLDRDAISHVRFENIWGVADEDLFDLEIKHCSELYARGKPFFSIVMTTSNHKPFTFRPGLEDLGIPEEGGGRKAGVKYADYALGYFLREAAKQPWFDDTVFVVVADHGARVYGKADIPLNSYEIPLMIYAPKHLAPRRVDDLMTQIDIAPTVLGLLGLPYEAPFFGQDVLHAPAESRVALFSHDHDVAIYRDGRLAVLGMDGSVRDFLYDRSRDSFEPTAADPALDALGIAYFQTASELFEAHHYE